MANSTDRLTESHCHLCPALAASHNQVVQLEAVLQVAGHNQARLKVAEQLLEASLQLEASLDTLLEALHL